MLNESNSGEKNENDEEHLNVTITDENTFRMLEFFQQEWQYRHQCFWNITIKLFSLNLFVTMLPFIVQAFGVTLDTQAFPRLIFPCVGILLAFVSFFIASREAERLTAVGKSKYNIIAEMPKIYRYVKIKEKNKKNLSGTISLTILLFQIFVSIVVVIIIILQLI